MILFSSSPSESLLSLNSRQFVSRLINFMNFPHAIHIESFKISQLICTNAGDGFFIIWEWSLVGGESKSGRRLSPSLTSLEGTQNKGGRISARDPHMGLISRAIILRTLGPNFFIH